MEHALSHRGREMVDRNNRPPDPILATTGLRNRLGRIRVAIGPIRRRDRRPIAPQLTALRAIVLQRIVRRSGDIVLRTGLITLSGRMIVPISSGIT